MVSKAGRPGLALFFPAVAAAISMAATVTAATVTTTISIAATAFTLAIVAAAIRGTNDDVFITIFIDITGATDRCAGTFARGTC